MAASIEPCPFCRDQHLLIRNALGEYSVICQNCRASGPLHSQQERALLEWNQTARKMRSIQFSQTRPSSSTPRKSLTQLVQLNRAIKQLQGVLEQHPGNVKNPSNPTNTTAF